MKKILLCIVLLLALAGCQEQVVRIGEPAPDLAVTNISGQVQEFNDWQGHYTYLTFWSSTCSACLIELTAIKPLVEQYGHKIQVLAVNVDSQDMPMANLDRFSQTYTVLRDSLGISKERYLVEATPTTYIIDGQGIVRMVYVGMQDSQKLADLFEQMAADRLE